VTTGCPSPELDGLTCASKEKDPDFSTSELNDENALLSSEN